MADRRFNDQKYLHKKEAVGSPLNCRVKTGGNEPDSGYNRFNQYFSWAGTPVPYGSEPTPAILAKQAQTGLIFPASHP